MKKLLKILLVLVNCISLSFCANDVYARSYPTISFDLAQWTNHVLGSMVSMRFLCKHGDFSNERAVVNIYQGEEIDIEKRVLTSTMNFPNDKSWNDTWCVNWDTSRLSLGTYTVEYYSEYYNDRTSSYVLYRTADCQVRLVAPVYAESVSLNYSSYTLVEDDTLTLTAYIFPQNCTESTLTWKSSRNEVASVSDGIVTAISPGTTTITVRTVNGLQAQCHITVLDKDFPFTDVKEGRWYYSVVKEAFKAGLMSGTDKITFSPNDDMTRGMIVTVLHRIAGKPDATPQSRFPDVGNKSYCAIAVEWAASNKVVSGYSNGKFGPNDNITRQDVAVILYNYARKIGLNVTNDTDLSKFKDYKNVSNYAKPAMEWAVSVGILGGATDKVTGEVSLNPKNNATRAECAKMLLVASKIYSDK